MLEPYVLKGTRTVPRRGEMSNHLFLFDNIFHSYRMDYLRISGLYRSERFNVMLKYFIEYKYCLDSNLCIIKIILNFRKYHNTSFTNNNTERHNGKNQ